MITKKKWEDFKRQHPSICATCYFYCRSKKENIGYCYGTPPTIDGKTITVSPNRRACSIHQNINSDIHKMFYSGSDDLLLVYEILFLIVSGISDNNKK